MEKSEGPDRYALNSRMELLTLTFLVEAMLMAMEPEEQEAALALFVTGCEAAISSGLSYAQRDATVHALQRAVDRQKQRLEDHGLHVPPLPPS